MIILDNSQKENSQENFESFNGFSYGENISEVLDQVIDFNQISREDGEANFLYAWLVNFRLYVEDWLII